jgi:hypothetical protein
VDCSISQRPIAQKPFRLFLVPCFVVDDVFQGDNEPPESAASTLLLLRTAAKAAAAAQVYRTP